MAYVIDAVLQLKDQFSNTLKDAEQKLAEFNRTWRRTGKEIQAVGRDITNVGKDMTTRITAPVLAAGAAAFTLAADYEDSLGAVEQIFKDSQDAVKEWSDNLPSYYGIAKDQALEYSSIMGAMLKNIGGLSEADAAMQSGNLVELAGDLSAMYGGTAESAIQALTGALKGNNTMLDNYGMGVNEATIKTKALEMGLESAGGQLSLADKQAATLALIMEQTADAQGQAAREAEQASGSWKALKTEFRNLAITLGQEVIPIVLPVIQQVGRMVKRLGELDDRTKGLIIRAALFAASIGPILMVIGMATTKVGGLVISFSKFGAAVTKAGGLAKWAMALVSGPAFTVVAVITALIAIGILLAANWDKVKAKAEEIWPGIGDFFLDLGARIKIIGGQFIELGGVIAGFFKSEFSKTFKDLEPIIRVFGDVIMTTIMVATQVLRGLIEFLVGAFTGDWGRAWNGIKTIFASIWDSMKEKGRQVLEWLLGKVNELISKVGDSRLAKFLTGGRSTSWGNVRTIGQHAKGTNFFEGGLTWLHEQKPEIVELPRGTKIFPHSRSLTMAYDAGQKSIKNNVPPMQVVNQRAPRPVIMPQPEGNAPSVTIQITGDNHYHGEADEDRMVQKAVKAVGRALKEAQLTRKRRITPWNAV